MSHHSFHFDKPTQITDDGQGLTRSATVTSHIKNATEHNLKRSVSVSTHAENGYITDNKMPAQLSTIKKGKKTKSIGEPTTLFYRLSGDFNEPWEMYFDPNYTFFGGIVFERRRKRQQQEVLQAMALQDRHLHLYPPPSSLSDWTTNSSQPSPPTHLYCKTPATTFLDHPTLPLAVMNSVHCQLLTGQIQQSANTDTSDDNDDSDLGLQQGHHTLPFYSPPPKSFSPVNEQEHHARLALLQAIRTETYHKSTFSATGANPSHQKQQVLPVVGHSRPSRKPSLRWVEKKAEALKHKCQTSSSSLNLSTLQDNDIMTLEEKCAPSPLQHTIRADPSETKTMPANRLVTPSRKTLQCRLSFLYFIFGFVFPPIWVIGALYTPPEKKYQSSKGRRIDLMWKRACRLAFGIFIFALLILLVAILALNPGALGWRTSRSDQNSAQKFVPVVQPASASTTSQRY